VLLPGAIGVQHERVLTEVAEDVPEHFGPFRVASVLGRGGMGVVYRAVHVDTGERVAVKTVTKQREFDLMGLRREIHALQRLDHPGVVRIVDAGVRDGIPWYAMPLLEGETLAQFGRGLRVPKNTVSETRATRVDGGISATQPAMSPLLETPDTFHDEQPLAGFGKLEQILTIARRLCSTLAFIHGEGIVHRDLTPANVFIMEDEHPRLLDFGLFRRFAGDEGRESIDDPFGFTGGTLGYMSPEQARGDLADARSDLYALGVILYELLTGRVPRGKPILPPGVIARDVPKAIDAMVMKLLADDPKERFGHATELVPILAAHGAREAAWEKSITPRGYLYRPRMIGRADALAAIDERLARALDRKGSVVLIAGESGIGKTYLAMHAARQASSYGVQILASSCGAPGAAERPPLHPFRAILQAVADACIANPSLTEKLLGDNGRILATVEPRLASLPSLPQRTEADSLTGEGLQRRLFAALGALLDAYGSTWPCVLLLDDLQWADELTLRFLASLPTDWFEDKGMLIVATYRVDEDNLGIRILERRPWALRVELKRLGAQDVRVLVRDMLALADPPPAWIAALTRASGGNPFFVAEYLRSAIADGTLRRDAAGQWRFETEVLELPSAPRIDAIIGRRLDALSAGARAMLSALVVLDRDADAEVAAAMAELSEEDALEAVRELTARQIVETRDRFINVLHDALRETAYRALDRDRRKALHRRAADLVEARNLGAPDFPLLYGAIARHCVEGGDAVRGARYHALAGERALSTFANREALGHFRAALALADQAGTDPVRRARFERRIAEAQYALGDLRASEDHLFRALEHLGEARPRTLAWAASIARDLPLQFAHRVSTPSVARDEVERERLAEAARVFDLLAERAYYGLDASVMVAASLRSVNRAERAGVAITRPYAMLGLTVGLGKLHGLARRYFSLAHAAADRDRSGAAFAAIAETAFHMGEAAFGPARALIDRAIDLSTRARDPKHLGLGETLLGHELFYRGRFNESLEVYRRLEERARREENQQFVAWGLYAGARALIPLGQLNPARIMLREADALLAALDDAPSSLICTGLLAAVELRRGDHAAASIAVERAAVLIRSLPPTVFSTISGYLGVCEVTLDAASRNRASLAAARKAVSDLERFAFTLPLGRPAAMRMRAALYLLEGDTRRAVSKLEKAVAEASRLQMRHEEALAQTALARATGNARHRDAAAQIFFELNVKESL
jgi:eukaryotic-like serine/threonine-protein kinase